MKRTISLLLGMILLFASLPGFAYEGTANVWKAIYVSPSGDDNGDGTENIPFKTIVSAQAEVRK